MLDTIKSVLVDEDGATLVEYGLIVALIAGACIVVITTLGTTISTAFTNLNGKIGAA
jgi:pilus assembly protein Flp/PilA